MARRNQHIISFRVGDRLLERVYKFALDNGLYNAEDQPNVSAALTLLVTAGLQDQRKQADLVGAYEVARSSLLSEVRRELNNTLENIAERIR